MQEKKLICHASGNFSQPFFNGFAFFCLNPNPKSTVDAPYNGSLEAFKNDWVEVEFSADDPDPQPYEFLQETLTKFAAKLRKREALAAKSFYKSVTLNVDQAGRSDRYLTKLLKKSLKIQFLCLLQKRMGTYQIPALLRYHRSL